MNKDLIKKLGIGILIILSLFVFVWNRNNEHEPEFINVKYLEEEVDIAHSRWEYLNTAGSSFIQGAWYDDKEEYMIINLSGTYYHYCQLPSSVWGNFKKADSFGTEYNRSIRGKFDCRGYEVPKY